MPDADLTSSGGGRPTGPGRSIPHYRGLRVRGDRGAPRDRRGNGQVALRGRRLLKETMA
jgi:hypothetical protein